MRTALILLILISAPASLFVLGWGLILIYEAAGLTALVLSSLSLFIAALGIASLLDKHQ
jgi:hypothetical protein